MDTIIKHAHSGLRWIVIFGILMVIVLAAHALLTNRKFSPLLKKLVPISAGFMHLQLILGFILYAISPKVMWTAETMKNDLLRFFTVEHLLMMVVAIVLITIGSAKVKRTQSDVQKLKKSLIFFLIGFIVMLVAIPWPWQNLSVGWF